MMPDKKATVRTLVILLVLGLLLLLLVAAENFSPEETIINHNYGGNIINYKVEQDGDTTFLYPNMLMDELSFTSLSGSPQLIELGRTERGEQTFITTFVIDTTTATFTEGSFTNTVEAGSYKEALTAFKREQPDLVLLDLILPDKGGMEVLREVRKTDKKAKFIIISAIGQQQSLDEARKLGVNEYIIKPFEEKKVLATIKKVLG